MKRKKIEININLDDCYSQAISDEFTIEINLNPKIIASVHTGKEMNGIDIFCKPMRKERVKSMDDLITSHYKHHIPIDGDENEIKEFKSIVKENLEFFRKKVNNYESEIEKIKKYQYGMNPWECYLDYEKRLKANTKRWNTVIKRYKKEKKFIEKILEEFHIR